MQPKPNPQSDAKSATGDSSARNKRKRAHIPRAADPAMTLVERAAPSGSLQPKIARLQPPLLTSAQLPCCPCSVKIEQLLLNGGAGKVEEGWLVNQSISQLVIGTTGTIVEVE